MTGCLDVHAGSPAVARLGLGAVAAAYQRLGFPVLGLGVGSKAPHKLFRHGVKWATTEPAMVPWMWGQEKMAGIGIACGQPSGLLVIDLDVKGSDNGRVNFGAYMLEHRVSVPMSLVSHTPSGGWHIWLRLPPGVIVPRRTGILGAVDIQAQDSYVVVPPSHVRVDYDADKGEKPGSVLLPYTWAAGCPCTVPEAPRWLLEWVLTAPGGHGGSGGDGSDDGDGGPDLDEAAEHGLPVGERNITLMRLACKLYRRYGSADRHGQARAAIDKALEITDRSGFSGTEQERTIASARSFVARQEAEELAAWQSVYGRR